MSDWLEQGGKKYFEESYLILANANAKRRGEEITRLRAELEAQREIAAVFERGQQNAAEQLERAERERDMLREALALLRHDPECWCGDRIGHSPQCVQIRQVWARPTQPPAPAPFVHRHGMVGERPAPADKVNDLGNTLAAQAQMDALAEQHDLCMDAPEPAPEEPKDCAECDGTGNLYRHDEDGDFLPCDECNGTGRAQ